ncbi:MAG TPA: CaiB/BaiF CoA-transferase family protein [Candidatus Binataceae bacterium]|jgi:crotonobetainyl-CoA:carnitine CoA-transferase CaiB-like acyl-CoA transferase|nr:CaiB/BaiF CoA-transferase family protein [Candidatus Binataceae bacterium]
MADSFLSDVKVLELGDEKGEFCGKLFAGAGADVIKVEPPGGGRTRLNGPFYHDQPDPARSLYFWHYNVGKRGVTLDIQTPQAKAVLEKLIARADVLIDSLPLDTLSKLGLDWAALQKLNPRLIYLVITPFGRSGPWRDYKATDLIHLALGGPMMCCGYDPKPDGTYDTPPIAAQMWHAYQIACNQAFIGAVGALIGREVHGNGEMIDVPIHQAVAVSTEVDVPIWIYSKKPVLRQTGRHASPRITPQGQFQTRDGRYSMLLLGITPREGATLIEFLTEKGFGDELNEKFKDVASRRGPEFNACLNDALTRCMGAFGLEEIWKEAEGKRISWAAIRLPEENLTDEHWRMRQTFAQVEHPELGETFPYVGAPTLAEQCPWRTGPRAPLPGEHNQEIYSAQLGLSAQQVEELSRKGII